MSNQAPIHNVSYTTRSLEIAYEIVTAAVKAKAPDSALSTALRKYYDGESAVELAEAFARDVRKVKDLL